MRTITISVDDSIYQKFIGFLDLLPKGKVKVIQDDKQKKLEALQNDIKLAISDVNAGRSKVIRIIK
ncbi:MAG TPA: hypothetical protein PLV58_08035 [Campylobacterales bacterium]|nr:hypothetical protein [Campylobacterales bacterium]